VKEVFALETPDVTHSTTQSQLQKAWMLRNTAVITTNVSSLDVF
jgi:hypothetical protein